MSEKPFGLFLLILIFVLGALLVFTLDVLGVVSAADYLPFLRSENPKMVEDRDFPTEVEKLRMKKKEEALLEKQETLAQKEDLLKQQEEKLKAEQKKLEEIQKSLEQEKKKLALMKQDLEDRKAKIRDLARKVGNMPPEKAKEMLENLPDFDVIDILREMDKEAEREGRQSITAYLLTLFNPQRRAEIARKMLLPPVETEESTN
ncbi:MAG: flagellar protein FlbB [Candidatus Hydrogenedentota bacterium]|nr:MAG: flagellar protein FlbB [Candidatus Hydrogenedentota bacterium]